MKLDQELIAREHSCETQPGRSYIPRQKNYWLLNTLMDGTVVIDIHSLKTAEVLSRIDAEHYWIKD